MFKKTVVAEKKDREYVVEFACHKRLRTLELKRAKQEIIARWIPIRFIYIGAGGGI